MTPSYVFRESSFTAGEAFGGGFVFCTYRIEFISEPGLHPPRHPT